MIHLIRHAESVHNVDKDFSRLDPELTVTGKEQSRELGRRFPFADQVGLIIVSPLRRAIQTTLHAFPSILDKQYFDPSSGEGIDRGVKLLLDPDFQERSALPCDTGSDAGALRDLFPYLDFSHLDPEWQRKQGRYAADQAAVDERASRARATLNEYFAAMDRGEKKDIVVVTHGVFMKALAGDPDINLPRPGWKSYTIKVDQGHGVLLEAVPEGGTG
jgi:broad specificity phosphatase PhoE